MLPHASVSRVARAKVSQGHPVRGRARDMVAPWRLRHPPRSMPCRVAAPIILDDESVRPTHLFACNANGAVLGDTCGGTRRDKQGTQCNVGSTDKWVDF